MTTKEHEALAHKHSAEHGEPVWIQPNHLQLARRAPFLCRVEPKQRDDFVSLYTSPPNVPTVRARKPLTDKEVAKIVDEHTYDDHGYDIWCHGAGVARAIEAAHGIYAPSELNEKNT